MPHLTQLIADYGSAWQERDASKRSEFLNRCFSEHGRYVDPTAAVTGRENLSAHIGEVLDGSGGRVEITSAPASHHDVVHFTWHMVRADGTTMVEGHDFAQLDTDGKIESLAGFFGSPEPLT